MFIHNESIAQLVKEYRDTGIIPDALHIAVYTICNGVAKRFGGDHFGRHTEREDIACKVYIKIIQSETLKNIDGNKNPHSYLSTIAFNGIRDYLRRCVCEDNAYRQHAEAEAQPYILRRDEKCE